MQGLPRQTVEEREQFGRQPAVAVIHECLLTGPIELVSDDGMAKVREVHANLVLAPRLRRRLNQGVASEGRVNLVARDRWQAIRLDAHQDVRPRVHQSHGRIDDARRWRGDTVNERQVHLLHAAVGKGTLEEGRGGVIARNEQNARRFAIDAVADLQPLVGETLAPVITGVATT